MNEIVLFFEYLIDIPRTWTIFFFMSAVIYASFLVFDYLKKKLNQDKALIILCVFFGIVSLLLDYIIWIRKP